MAHGTSICGDAHDAVLWKARARDLAALCAVSAPCEERERLDEALSLLAQRGPIAGPHAGNELDEAGLAALVAAGGSLSAAVTLLGESAGYMISRGQGGVCMATVVLDGSGREETAEGASPALALLGAYLMALLALVDADRPASGWLAGSPSMRLN
jgi:hypothetical protein